MKVTRLFMHFVDYGFYKVFSYKLKLCAREFSWVVGDWSVRVKYFRGLVVGSPLQERQMRRAFEAEPIQLFTNWYFRG